MAPLITFHKASGQLYYNKKKKILEPLHLAGLKDTALLSCIWQRARQMSRTAGAPATPPMPALCLRAGQPQGCSLVPREQLLSPPTLFFQAGIPFPWRYDQVPGFVQDALWPLG